MDRLTEISAKLNFAKKGRGTYGYAYLNVTNYDVVQDMEWVLTEVKRLRRIEDAARVDYYGSDEICHLMEVLKDNPHPSS